MLQNSIALFCGLTLIFSQANGQTFKQQFNDLFSKKDSIGQFRLLEKWEATDSSDAELFVAYFNYYVNTSRKEFIRLGHDPKGQDVLQIMNQDTTKKEPVGFLYGDAYFDPVLLNTGFDWIDKGIEAHPNRLDMRFGKIYMLGQTEDYEKFTQEIVGTIDYSAVNNNGWTWSDSEPLEDPKEFMLSSIQDYQIQLFNTENDSLLDNMKRIAVAVLNHYPDHVQSLTNLAIAYMLQEQFEAALEPLLKAEQLDPKDYIVLSNIAHAYKQMGDTKNAIRYYELMSLHGNEEAKSFAQRQIDELKGK